MQSSVAVALTLLLCIAGVRTEVSYYGSFSLTTEQRQSLVDQACFRGTFGSDMLHLHTCEETSDFPSKLLFTAPSDAALCLLELSDETTFRRSTLDLISSFADQATLLATLPSELILVNPSNSSEYTSVCSRSDFNGMVVNAIFVPRQAIVGQQGARYDSPAFLRAQLPLESLAGRTSVQAYLNKFTEANVKSYVAWLSTDRQGENTKITRNSYAIKTGAGGCADASTWRCAHTVVDELVNEIKTLMKSYPYPWTVEKKQFRTDMCANVRLIINGSKSNSVVIMGAHIDSRNTASSATATGPAPGADDNGSGSAVNLAAVKAIASNTGTRFSNGLHIVWFCGEEQGLLGSAAMAQDYKNAKTDVIMMINADMIGYTDTKYGVTLSFDQRATTAWVTDSCKKFSQTYQPTLQIGNTNGCCSDNQSFFNQGFPTAGIFETPTTGISYPQYHKSGDTWNSGLINYQQITQFGKSALACVLEYADPV